MKKRLLWIDVLRIIAIFSVIVMHVIGNTTYTLNVNNTIYNIINVVLYSVMPLFVMISGILFLDKDINYKDLFKKYILRILLVLIIFGSLFSFMEIYFNNSKVLVSDIKIVFMNLITGNLWVHMWYLYMILGLYIITPILRYIIKYDKDYKNGIIFMIILYIFTILVPELNYGFKINIQEVLPINSGFLFIYMLGYYLYKIDIKGISKIIIYILGIIGLINIVMVTLNKSNYQLIGYTSTSTISVASSILILFKGKKICNNEKVSKLISSIGVCCFGIYILHQILINIIYKILRVSFIIDYPYIGLVLYSLGIFIVTYVIVLLLRKIKLVRDYLF